MAVNPGLCPSGKTWKDLERPDKKGRVVVCRCYQVLMFDFPCNTTDYLHRVSHTPIFPLAPHGHAGRLNLANGGQAGV